MVLVHFYHTNDLHSQFANWPQTVEYLKQKMAARDKGEEDSLFLDIGDHMDRANSITEGTMGHANVLLQNQLGYDYITIGNNEGITFPKQVLSNMYDDSLSPVILANLFNEKGERPDWATPYVIHTLQSGIKIGITGVTAPFTDFYVELGWDIRNSNEILPDILKTLKSQSDIVVLMSHLGLNADEWIAEHIQGFDAIFGAHTHHVLKNGLHIGDTVIGQAGKFGRYIGKTTINYDLKERKVIDRQMEAIPVEGKKNQETLTKIKDLAEVAKENLSGVVGILDKPLPIDWFQESPFAKLLVQALREWCHADVGMANSGLLLGSLSRGEVTRGQLHEICPHPINPCLVKLSGQEIKETIEKARQPEFESLALKGFGFRGIYLGTMVYDQLTFDISRSNPSEIYNIRIKGEPLIDDRIYSVGTVDMFTFGRLLPKIKEAKDKHYFLPEMLRDLLAWKLSV